MSSKIVCIPFLYLALWESKPRQLQPPSLH